jgi:phosphatidylglycerophosphatase A
MSGAASRTARALATWFGCGLVPKAPGTMGTLGAIPLYWLVVREGGQLAVAVAALLVTSIGVWAASVVQRDLGVEDPQVVVIDEVAGVLFVLAASPPTLIGTAVGVVLFRLFDQLKPWPAFVAERGLPGGWGVVFDDVFAGAWGAAAITALVGMGAI